MIVRNQSGQRLQTRIAMLCALALLLCAGVWWVGSGGTGQVFTAYFGKTVGIYPDSDVRVIGIDVGKVDSVTPQGKQVRVKFSVNRDVPVPANAKAVVVAPTVVSDRYIQLTPSYVEGPRMTSGAVFGRDRTATPVELDQIYANATKLAEALGPDGANKSGALTKVLNSAARNFKGNGAALHDTLHNLAKAANTLSGSKDDLFGTVKHLGDFTKALADNDAQVRDFETRLADVSQFLSDDSGKFGSALSELGDSLVKVKGFIGDNSDLLSKNVDKLIGITKVLVDQRGALAETLDTAPVGISGYLGAYDQASGTVATRGDLGELTFGPVQSICRALTINTPNRSQTKDPNKLCDSIANTVDNGLNLPSLAQILSWLWAPKGTPFPTPNKGGGK